MNTYRLFVKYSKQMSNIIYIYIYIYMSNIKYKSHKNKGNDQQFQKLLTVTQVILVTKTVVSTKGYTQQTKENMNANIRV